MPCTIREDQNYLEERLISQVNSCLSLAERHYQRPFWYQEIKIDMRGRSAGQVVYRRRHGLAVVRFNPFLLKSYKQKYIDEVVPHECAHLIANTLYDGKIKPHGKEWQHVMTSLFDRPPKVTHSFEIEHLSDVRFSYLCECAGKVHRLSTIRHNKVTRGKAEYLCRNCKCRLKEEVLREETS